VFSSGQGAQAGTRASARAVPSAIPVILANPAVSSQLGHVMGIALAVETAPIGELGGQFDRVAPPASAAMAGRTLTLDEVPRSYSGRPEA
jgi:hypothetical protein